MISFPFQPNLLGSSPTMKSQETDSERYGIFGRPPSLGPAGISDHVNKENMPEVSVPL